MSPHLPFPTTPQSGCHFILILRAWKRTWREVELSDQSPRKWQSWVSRPAARSRDHAAATRRGPAWSEAPGCGGQTQSSPRGCPPAAGAAIPGAGPAGLTPSRERPWLPGLAGFPFRPVPRLVRPRDEGRQLSSWAGIGLCKLRGIRGADGRGSRQGAGSLDRRLRFTAPRAEPEPAARSRPGLPVTRPFSFPAAPPRTAAVFLRPSRFCLATWSQLTPGAKKPPSPPPWPPKALPENLPGRTFLRKLVNRPQPWQRRETSALLRWTLREGWGGAGLQEFTEGPYRL